MTSSVQTPQDLSIQDQMKQAMRRLAASVTVITSRDQTRRYAMTATAVTSLSMDPPALLVCVNNENGIHNALGTGNGYCVNILFSDQQDISENCAWREKGENKFNLGDWRDGPEGLPYLANAQASIFCDTDGAHAYGSHTIFIGKVSKVISREEISPLIFLDGNYTGS
ncbi:flavin reductase family protein [Paremcibacter congregatus]|uniref:Flavin reductase domain-containing protein n=1 Tax=Paremcibacter congregatus TaxID=2043170 RepID=A0A2G4YPX2_9PROT|nr:flavin reductase family protein [Paremcibacter congregatus]PHZ84345.1 flavin reductase domain-containing protein [Paremcibacter congregatus]QDE28565.1 flavin reductase family protein [Paremcibacter congregatus]